MSKGEQGLLAAGVLRLTRSTAELFEFGVSERHALHAALQFYSGNNQKLSGILLGCCSPPGE